MADATSKGPGSDPIDIHELALKLPGEVVENITRLVEQVASMETRIATLEEQNTQLNVIARDHSSFIQTAHEMLNPLNKAMAEAFLSMVLKHNPINEEERAALDTVRQDPAAAPLETLVTALHAAEREILDGSLNAEDLTGYTGALLIIRTELIRRGVPVEMREAEVKAALEAADVAGREQVSDKE